MKEMVGEWAKENSPNRICGPDLLDFFRLYTDGHVGVLDALLETLEKARVKSNLVL